MIHTAKATNEKKKKNRMIEHIVARMKKDGEWQYFTAIYDQMIDEIISDMRSGNIKTTEKLLEANVQLDLLERVKNIDSYSGRNP